MQHTSHAGVPPPTPVSVLRFHTNGFPTAEGNRLRQGSLLLTNVIYLVRLTLAFKLFEPEVQTVSNNFNDAVSNSAMQDI